MRRAFPRDPILYARLAALVGAALFLTLGGATVLPLVLLALGLLALTSFFVWRDDLRRGHALTIVDAPLYAIVGDLLAAGLWMVATAPNPRSLGFVVVLCIGVIAMFRLGRRRGGLITVAVYLAARVGQEAVRLAIGQPTPLPQIVAEPTVVLLVMIVLAATVGAYRREQDRTTRALERARALERVATEVTGELDAEAVLRRIPHTARAVVDADHAALIVRKDREFEVVAGAGTAERIVGLRASADVGIVGDVSRQRSTVCFDDYSTHPAALAAARSLGLRSAMGVPLFVHGEIAAVLLLARLDVRPFEADEARAAEGFAAHAAVALANARTVDLARRVEAVTRLALTQDDADDVLRRIAREAAAAFIADFVVLAEIEDETRSRVVAALGVAEPIAGERSEHLGPVLKEIVRTADLVSVRDYVAELGRDATDAGGTIAMRVGLRAAIAAPIAFDGEVRAVLIVGTTDPYRGFDAIDRQGLLGFAASAGTALRAVEARRERDRRIAQLASLNTLAIRLAQVQDHGAICRLAWETAGTLVRRDSFYVARYDAEQRQFNFLFQEDEGVIEEADPEEWREGEMVVPLGGGPTSQVIETGQPYVTREVEDPVQHAGRRYGRRGRNSASAVHVPLRSGTRIVGALSAQSYEPRMYDDEDVEVLQSLANLVASAFENVEHVIRTRDLYLASVKALAAAVDARDPYTRSHSARVAALSRIIAEELGLASDEIRRVQLGALLHDIGKIGIPDAILNKPAALSPEEWVIMRTHSALGASIVESVEPLRDLAPIVRCHHERFDGAGYPDQLRGGEVPLGAYIVAVADAYEVIVSRRAYKAARTVDQAVAELNVNRGTQFHPDAVDALLQVIERDRTEGTGRLSRVGAIQHEDIEDVPGPGEVLQRYAARSRTHARHLAVLQRLASEISAVLDLDEIAARLLRIVCDAMGYEMGFLLTLDEGGEALVVTAASGPAAGYAGQTLPRGTGISWWVMEHGRLQNVPDVHADTRFFGAGEIRSSLIVPLSMGDERVGVIGIESTKPGAFDLDDEELLSAVSHQVAAAVRVARLHERAQTAASTDPLTGLPNRRVFFERVEAGLRQAVDGVPLSLAMVDVDLLKDTNDRFGHAAGDEALVRIGEILAAGVRGEDTVARIGGDEFGIVFQGAPIFSAEKIVRRLADDIAQALRADGVSLPTISWGVVAAPTTPTTVDALLDGADRAMYRRKQTGRHRSTA